MHQLAKSRAGSESAFTLIELLVVTAIIATLSALLFAASRGAVRAASLAASAANIRSLSAGAMAYLTEHENVFWKSREAVPGEGVRWWYGLESSESMGSPEGSRWFDASRGPLGGYIPSGFKPDPSFAMSGKPFKPKYRSGYIGVGYNVMLSEDEGIAIKGWVGTGKPRNRWTFERPGEIVVFATSAQVNTFQAPASASNPMIEEFCGIDSREITVHFRHNGKAMVAFANGAAGFLEMDKSTLDKRDPGALVARFAPVGSTKSLLPQN
jgi:prepilin-type N-terminal cleavage/methylation domain-containing protein